MFKLLFSLFFCFSIFTTPVFAQTESWENIQSSLGAKCYEETSTGTKVATLQGFACIFANVLRLIIPLSGLVAFVVLIVGGFQFLTSAGDPKKLQQATSVITAAIIGIIVVLGIWLIFILLGKITGLDLLQFTLPGTTPSCLRCGVNQPCCTGACVGTACIY